MKSRLIRLWNVALLSVLLSGGLLQSAGAQGLDHWMKEAEHERFQVRVQAALAMGKMGTAARGAVLLLDKLLYDPARPVCQAAASALAKISGPDDNRSLLTALRNKDVKVRQDVVQGLRAAPNATIALLKQALADEDSQVREHAVVALGEGSGSSVVRLLSQAAAQDEDAFVREKALQSIRILTRKDASTTKSAWGTVLQSLEDSADRVRTEALRAMVALDPYQATNHFEALLDDRSPLVRGALFQELSSLGGRKVLTVLDKALEHPQLAVRRESIGALKALGRSGLSGILRGLSDPSAEVRLKALQAIAKPPPSEAIAPLVALAQDPVANIRGDLVETLASAPATPSVDKALKKLLEDSTPQVRIAAVKGAVQYFQDGVVEVLAENPTDDDLVVFRAKLEAIAQPKTSKSASVLAKLLSNQQEGIFRTLIFELLLDMPKYAAGALVSVLHSDPNPDLELLVVETLGTLKDPRPAQDLMALVQDETTHTDLKVVAAESLAKLNHREAAPVLENEFVHGAAMDPDSERRLVEAIAQLGGSSLFVLKVRRNLFWLALVGSLLVSAGIWHFFLKGQLADREVKAQEKHLKELEARAKEPKRAPSESEFLEQLDQKLAGNPGRGRKVRYLTQRGLIRYIQKSYSQATSDLDQVTRIFDRDDPKETKARVHYFLGKAALGKEDLQTAQRQLTKALGFHDKKLCADVISETAQDPGNLDRSIRLLEENLPFDDDINVTDVQNLKVI